MVFQKFKNKSDFYAFAIARNTQASSLWKILYTKLSCVFNHVLQETYIGMKIDPKIMIVLLNILQNYLNILNIKWATRNNPFHKKKDIYTWLAFGSGLWRVPYVFKNNPFVLKKIESLA